MNIEQFAVGCEIDSKVWFPEAAGDLTVLALGLCGEAGEFADIVKKIARGSISVQDALPSMREELVDVGIYWASLLKLLDMHDTFAAHYNKKRVFNQGRFGNGSQA